MKPTDVKISHLGSDLVADREAVLECSAYGSRPKAVLHWFFDGQKIATPLSTGSLGEHQTSTSITITPKREHDGSEITCTASNPKIPESAISDSVRLNVQCMCEEQEVELGLMSFLHTDIPHLSLVLGSPTLSLHSIQEGNDVYFDCLIQANPYPNRAVAWKLNGSPLFPSKGESMFTTTKDNSEN